MGSADNSTDDRNIRSEAMNVEAQTEIHRAPDPSVAARRNLVDDRLEARFQIEAGERLSHALRLLREVLRARDALHGPGSFAK